MLLLLLFGRNGPSLAVSHVQLVHISVTLLRSVWGGKGGVGGGGNVVGLKYREGAVPGPGGRGVSWPTRTDPKLYDAGLFAARGAFHVARVVSLNGD